MTFKKLIILLVFINLNLASLYAKEQFAIESDQQMNDFSLSGFGEKGKKSWDLSGKTADIFKEKVKLSDVEGNLYGKEEDVRLTADKGDFNKLDGKVHLEQNVVITTSSGIKMTTDTLDWDRQKQLVTTRDLVNIQRENITAVAEGARGEPNLKKVALEKDVRLDIHPVSPEQEKSPIGKEKIVVTCDGPLEIDYEKNIASFKNNVKVERLDAVIYSDVMDVFFVASGKEKKDSDKALGSPDKLGGLTGSKIEKIIARGHVKVVQGDNISCSEEATYTVSDRKIVLSGRPELIIYSSEGMK